MFDDTNEPPEEFYADFLDMLRSSLKFLVNIEPDAQKFIEMYTHCAVTGYFDFFDHLNTGNLDEKRNVARMFAIQIWNNTPLPSNHYRPKPLIKPKRNDPCFCGSGKKHKQCCARLETGEMPIMPSDVMTQCLLEVISKTELKQVWRHLPHPLLGFVAGEWGKASEELAERGVLLLDPIFKQSDAKLNQRDELAFDTLAELCILLDKPRKKNALVKRIMQHPDKILQAAALHRQCCILGDQGKDDEAWVCFQKAQRLDPNNPSLSHLEILLLMQQGKTEQMQQRGSYWMKRLAKMNRDGELDGLIDVIEEMLSDAPTAMGNLIEHDTPGASRLIAWLKLACKTPPRLMNKVEVYDGACAIEPNNKSAARLERDWNNLFITCDDPWENPGEWLSMLEAHPELAGSMLIIDDLIQFTGGLNTPNPMLTFEPLLMLSMFQIKQLLPQQPKVPLEWGFIGNRPALRILGFLATTMENMGDDKTAIEMMEWMLRLNPNDNQGFSSTVVNTYLRQHRDQDALALCERYPQAMLVSLCFGHTLALFRLGKKKQAGVYLSKADQQFPKVVKAISSKRLKQPKEIHPGMVMHGGDDEAWYYRNDARQLWLDTPGAMAWLKQCLKP
ncbi:MAG: SEC-C domain-containing protein [Mariprofundus sp.]|nr:SEC-C domain-containing protein [Mariprofundus sp.]